MNRRFGTIGHRFKASIGIRGESKSVTGSRKIDNSDMATLNKTRLPKYAATNLFLKVIAYTLRRESCQPLGDEGQKSYGVPHRDEDVRRSQEKSGQYHRSAELRKAPGGGEDDVSVKPSPLLHVSTDWISYPDCKQIRIKRVRTVRRAGRDIFVLDRPQKSSGRS